jgi:hypothetical protein
MVRLTPEQAIAIFRTRRTKTARTASRLVTKYGITPKAIRDIDAQDLGRRHPASLERVPINVCCHDDDDGCAICQNCKLSGEFNTSPFFRRLKPI